MKGQKMENKKYYIAIDKESKRYKVFEDREQGFRLTTIKHCKHLYVSLLDVKFSLKLNTSKFSMLKKNLAEAFKDKRLDRKSTRLNSSQVKSRMPSSA